jgi:hypothetical protein
MRAVPLIAAADGRSFRNPQFEIRNSSFALQVGLEQKAEEFAIKGRQSSSR